MPIPTQRFECPARFTSLAFVGDTDDERRGYACDLLSDAVASLWLASSRGSVRVTKIEITHRLLAFEAIVRDEGQLEETQRLHAYVVKALA